MLAGRLLSELRNQRVQENMQAEAAEKKDRCDSASSTASSRATWQISPASSFEETSSANGNGKEHLLARSRSSSWHGESPTAMLRTVRYCTGIDVGFIDTYVASHQIQSVKTKLLSGEYSKRMYTFTLNVAGVRIHTFTASFSVFRHCFNNVWPSFPSRHALRDYTWNETNVARRAEELRFYFEINLNKRDEDVPSEDLMSPQLHAAWHYLPQRDFYLR